jgi:putative transposase
LSGRRTKDSRAVLRGLGRSNAFRLPGELDQTMQMAFVMEALQRALEQAIPQICNSDQGSQFSSPQYTQLLLSHDVRISMDSKGRALDNIFTERLWRTIKYEEVYLNDYTSPREAREGLGNYLRFYNEQRIHQALDYQTPAEVYFARRLDNRTPLQGEG